LLSRWAFSVFLADKLRVENDGRIVLAAGTPDECGLALIAGTGSFALARNSQGKIVRAGGWGYLLGDDCGAYSIALAGLRAVARAADGSGPATEMTGAFLRRLNIASPAELIPKIYGELDRPAIAGLADVVTSAAAAGDVAANMILLGEADRLAAAAYSALQSASLTDSETVPAALAGSVLTSCPAIVDRIASALLNRGLKLDPIQLVEEPAQGAIRLARAIL
jgi:N-acetylglucosamine kinase-like BadF-type ATPase